MLQFLVFANFFSFSFFFARNTLSSNLKTFSQSLFHDCFIELVNILFLLVLLLYE